ncbi:MAG TPA: hypothetical protein VG711_03875, partial [Phycisphaerales bacterium]|nr:hypothetical protein [Phycisphaerales bacterium]
QGDEFGLLLGIGVYGQQGENNGAFSLGQRNETKGYGYTVDASFEFGGASLFFAWFHHYVDSPTLVLNWYGTVAQASIYVTPKLELFARHEYSWVDLHLDQGVSELDIATVGFNYYFEGHDVKLTADCAVAIYQLDSVFTADIAGFRPDLDGVWPQFVFRTQLQVLF